MSDTDELTDLLRTASRSVGGEVRPDTGALISRARQRRRRQRVVGVCMVAATALAGATAAQPLLDRGHEGVEVATGASDEAWSDPPDPGWTRLPDAPLSPRADAMSAWTGREVVVFGGAQRVERPCDAVTSCPPLPSKDLADGAAFDPATRRWRAIAPAPIPLSSNRASAVGGNVYVTTGCWLPACPDAPRYEMLRYRPAADAWDVLAAPPAGRGHALLPFGDDLVAVDWFPERGEPADFRFDTSSGSWSPLPKDPLPPAQVRGMRVEGEDLLLFAHGGEEAAPAASPMSAARLDVATGDWRVLPNAPGEYHANALLDGVAFSDFKEPASAAIFDAATETWRPLPQPTGTSPGPVLWPGRLVGVNRGTSALYVAADGLVLDARSERWIELSPPDGRQFSPYGVTTLGRRLFTFGSLPREGGEPAASDAWVWTPPAAPADDAPPPTAVEGSTTTIASEAPPPPPPPPPPTTAAPGAPQLLSATADAATARVTVRFDRPVVGDPVDKSPGEKSYPPDRTTPMNLIVFGADPTCSSPQGNAHDYLAGLGTDTITTDATSLVAGTTYIAIGRGFVKSAADGTFNDPVVRDDLPKAGMFPMSCIPIEASGATPAPLPPYTDPPVTG